MRGYGGERVHDDDEAAVKTKLTWLAGCLCLAVALWIGTDVPGGGYSGQSPMALNWRVTKPYPRDRDPRMEKRAKDPREEFEAARKRGLTEEEVRWVVEDFVAMNLNPKSPDRTADLEDAREEWKRREQWYLDTLVSGFGLSEEQKKQAAGRLRELGEKEFSGYQEFLANRESLIEQASREGKIARWALLENLGTYGWFLGESRSPWNLCDLDEEQKKITGYADGEGKWVWIPGGEMTNDFGTDERYENLDDQQTSQNGFINPAGWIYPLSMGQVDRIRSANVVHVDHVNQGDRVIGIKPEIKLVSRLGILPYAKLLSEPQLRTYLLLRPEMAVHLSEELAKRPVIPKR